MTTALDFATYVTEYVVKPDIGWITGLTGQSLPALEYLSFELCGDLCFFIALSAS
jgi:hypothetical protein